MRAYLWIGCECCKGTTWVPFKLIRQQRLKLMISAIVELGAKMRCGKYGSKDVLCKGGAAGRYAGISKRY
jgi:hypothetical protein